MKFGFITCVELGLSCMEAIYEAGGHLDLAITLLDDKGVNKSGRVFLDNFCQIHNVPLVKCAHVNEPVVIRSIRETKIDWLFIIGWSQIAGSEILAATNKGVLGIHPSLLPIGRGRAAVPWAILKGLPETGVTLFQLDLGVDTGPILAQMRIPLTPQVTATELYAQVKISHVDLIHKAVPMLLLNQVDLIPQDNGAATLWPGRKPEDGQIDLSGSVWDAERLIRATTRPYPGAFYLNGPSKIVVWKAKVVVDVILGPINYLHFHDGFLLIEDFEEQIM
jgi:methionyl-tRNA formyltransferase